MTTTAMLKAIKDNIKPVPNRVYECNKCKDSGVITEIGKLGLPQIVRECECVRTARYLKILEKAGFKENLENCTFDTFKADTKQREIAKSLCKRFVTDKKANNLLLLGNSGTGKTHLAVAVGKELLETYQKPFRYMSFRETVDRIKGLGLHQDKKEEELFKYKDIEYLLIDDLFKNTNTNYTTEQQIMFQVLDYRYSNNKKTIVTSEHNLESLRRIDTAIAGRLIEKACGYIIDFGKLKIPDYRLDTAINAQRELNKIAFGG